jgi:hypothetical protein
MSYPLHPVFLHSLVSDLHLMTPRTYRTLLLASLAFGIVGAVYDAAVPSALPDVFSQAQEANDASLTTSYLLLMGLAALVLFVVAIAAFVGLYLFRSWAPRLAIIATAFAMLITILIGPMAASGWATAINELSSMLWGAAVVLPHLSPLKELFAQSDR